MIAKADLPTDDLRVQSWVPSLSRSRLARARGHGRCSGSTFDGHPGLRHIYLPGEFEGHPLRKDYPLLARRVKPWPGLVDVELMPETDDDDAATEDAAP